MKKLSFVAFVVGCSLGLFAGSSQAVPLEGFGCITEGGPQPNCSIAEDQISADLTDLGDGRAQLLIRVDGSEAAVVEQVFLESASVLGASFMRSAGAGIVAFEADRRIGSLPGGNQPTVNFIEIVSLGADNPAPRDGVGRHSQDDADGQAGLFAIDYSGSFDDLLGRVRVGVHVIGFADGGSVSAVTGSDSGPQVPEPTSALLFSVGALIAGHRCRRGA